MNNGLHPQWRTKEQSKKRYLEHKRWREKHRDLHLLGRQKNNRGRNKRKLEWLKNLKSTLTCACGERDPICFDAHHKNPKNKNGAIQHMSLTKLQKELEQCVWICANCHRKGHAGRPRPEHKEFFIALNHESVPDMPPFDHEDQPGFVR